MKRCYIQAVGIVSALGDDVESTRTALMRGDTRGMRVESGWLPDGNSCVGRVSTELPTLPAHLAQDDCRNNRLLAAVLLHIHSQLESAKAQWGPERIAVVIGTSTSGIAAGEAAMAAKVKHGEFPPSFSYRQQEIGATAPIAARLAGA
jgi:3-oxoacyl-[acyl-carrier-protein] synthase-1